MRGSRWLIVAPALLASIFSFIPSASAEPAPGLSTSYYTIDVIPPVQSTTEYELCGSEVENNINRSYDGEPYLDCTGDLFMVHMTGFITIPVHDTIEFWLATDDGGRINIDGNEWGNWGDQGCTWMESGEIDIVAGSQPLDLWMYENGGSSCLMLAWNIDNEGFAIVPDEAFTTDYQQPVDTTIPDTTIPDTTIPDTTIAETTTTWTTSTTTTSTTVAPTTVPATNPSTTLILQTTTTTTTQAPPPATMPPPPTTQAPPPETVAPPPATTSSTTTTSTTTTTTTMPPPPATVPPSPTTMPAPPETIPEPPATFPALLQPLLPPVTLPELPTYATVQPPQTLPFVAPPATMPPPPNTAPQPPQAPETSQPAKEAELPPITNQAVVEALANIKQATPAQVQAVVTELLAFALTTDQAVSVASEPAVLEVLTNAEAEQVFEQVAVEELSTEQAVELVAAVQEAPTKVRKAFEAVLNLFEGFADDYTMTNQTVPIKTRRALIALSAVFLVTAPAPIRRNR